MAQWRTGFRVDPDVAGHLGSVTSEVITQLVAEIADDARRYVPVDSGDLRSTIRAESLGARGRVWCGGPAVSDSYVDYHLYVEFGTRFMTAQPYMRPALYRTRHVARVRRP